jgi:ankyrin repeat protein
MEGGDELTINFLLKGGKKFTRMDILNLQSLHFSARIGDLNMVKDLHKKGCSLEMRDDKGQTALFHAIKGGQHDTAKWLLKEGKANVQAIDKEGLTPLYAAVQVVDKKMVSVLIKHRANVNARSNLHLTPLHRWPTRVATVTSCA